MPPQPGSELSSERRGAVVTNRMAPDARCRVPGAVGRLGEEGHSSAALLHRVNVRDDEHDLTAADERQRRAAGGLGVRRSQLSDDAQECIYLGTFPPWFASHSIGLMLLLPIAPRMPRFTVRPSVRDERQPVRIAIIGTGKMGRGFAQALAPTHEVVIGSRDPDWAAAIAVKTGATGGATYAGCG
jgi:NADP oxidoreductase coenzyme F420-dependent